MGAIVQLDFEKAFDSVSWQYIFDTLKNFNLGKNFIDWVKLCYTNIYSIVVNNGFSSGWFKISRGVRQGCPLSCVLFVLCVELLAHLIRENNDIHGIQVGEDGIKLSQFADDMFSFVSNASSIKRYLTHVINSL